MYPTGTKEAAHIADAVNETVAAFAECHANFAYGSCAGGVGLAIGEGRNGRVDGVNDLSSRLGSCGVHRVGGYVKSAVVLKLVQIIRLAMPMMTFHANIYAMYGCSFSGMVSRLALLLRRLVLGGT